MKPCRDCGAKIDWNTTMKAWVEVESGDIHYCTKAPENKGLDESNDFTIGKMLGGRADAEVRNDIKKREQDGQLYKNFYALDDEFHVYKRMTDKRIEGLEELVRTLQEQIKKLDGK